MAAKNTAVAIAPQQEAGDIINPFATIKGFEAARQMATFLAASPMVPQAYTNNIGSCVIALDIANRIGASPLMVMQNLYIVHGTPSWSSKFLIACFNSCRRFAPITYETNVNTEQDYSKWYCIAKSVILATGEEIKSDRITTQMVESEGWSKKAGSKWITMPGQMFRYRAAAFLIRAHAPEISFGFYTQDEVMDGALKDIDAEEVAQQMQEPEQPGQQPSMPAEPQSTQADPNNLFDNVKL